MYNRSIIDQHEQKYSYSCIPSCVEMILKLLRKVPSEYNDLQEEWKNKRNGSFTDFDNKVIAEIMFRPEFAIERNKDFPFEELFR